ncbi:MAG: hypothetical protein AAFR04_12610 [Pseudomonadota bacterium]
MRLWGRKPIRLRSGAELARWSGRLRPARPVRRIIGLALFAMVALPALQGCASMLNIPSLPSSALPPTDTRASPKAVADQRAERIRAMARLENLKRQHVHEAVRAIETGPAAARSARPTRSQPLPAPEPPSTAGR